MADLDSISPEIEAQMRRVMAAFIAACNRVESKRRPKCAAKYLRAHPQATWEEIAAATGCDRHHAKTTMRLYES